MDGFDFDTPSSPSGNDANFDFDSPVPPSYETGSFDSFGSGNISFLDFFR